MFSCGYCEIFAKYWEYCEVANDIQLADFLIRCNFVLINVNYVN